MKGRIVKQNRNWRLLANYTDGNLPVVLHLYSKKAWAKREKLAKQLGRAYLPLPDGSPVLERPSEFDELVVGDWLHIEQMGNDSYWMLVGGYRLWVDLSGKSVNVTNDGKELSDYGVVRDE